MSRIFRGDTPADVEALMAIIRVNPQIRIEFRITGQWEIRVLNYYVLDGKREFIGFSDGKMYRIKEDQS